MPLPVAVCRPVGHGGLITPHLHRAGWYCTPLKRKNTESGRPALSSLTEQPPA